MYAYRRTSKVLAIFLLAFVCLNAGGAACLAYCETFEISDADHCPLSRKSDHCNGAAEPSNSSEFIESTSVDCCQLPLAIIAVPVVNTESREKPAQAVQSTVVAYTAPIFTTAIRHASDKFYRPPPKDGSRLRFHHCTFLI
jgi:hypothetical protein